MKKKIKNFIRKGLFLLSINFIKTLYVNLKLLPFNQAKKLPIIIHGNVLISSLKGEIIFNVDKISSGMVKFGVSQEIIKSSTKSAELRVDGKFVINGSFSVGKDYKIIILKNGTLSIGEGTFIGSNTKIICANNIFLGKFIRLGFESQLSDSNYHFVKNLSNNEIKKFVGDIELNSYCWIGNRCSIMKGTKTPTNFIISSYSLCNKNYLDLGSGTMVGGIPAKLIKNNLERIYDFDKEKEILKYMKENNSNVFFDN